MIEYILLIVILVILLGWFFDKRETAKEIQQERADWKQERQQLLDRIQAPTFAEYTNKVVREKKIDKSQEEEKPIDWVG